MSLKEKTAQIPGVVDRRFDALLSGEKTDTIRLNEGDIAPGFLLYVSCSGDRRAVVYVTDVRSIPLKDVPRFAGYDARTPDDETLLRRREAHYPDITLETVILYAAHLSVPETRRLYPQQVAEILSARGENP